MGNYTLEEKQAFAESMRNAPTLAEAKLWKYLSSGKYGEWKTQVLILGYIVDFYCHKSKLAIEVDGLIHDQRIEEDKLRDSALRKIHGIRTLRVQNQAVLTRIDSVLNRVQSRTASSKAKTKRNSYVPNLLTPKPAEAPKSRIKTNKIDWSADPKFNEGVAALVRSLPKSDRDKTLKILDATCRKYFSYGLAVWLSRGYSSTSFTVEAAIMNELTSRLRVKKEEVTNINPALKTKKSRRLEGYPRLNVI